MNRRRIIKLSFLLCSLFSFELAAEFKFQPPKFAEGASGQVFSYFLPANSGFAANINLQIQPFPGTLKEYDAITQEQFKSLNINVISAKTLDSEIKYEYSGHMSGNELRWFARAIKKDDEVYLITATALNSRWELEKTLLINSVMSFSL